MEKKIKGMMRRYLDKQNLKMLRDTDLLCHDSLDLMSFFYGLEREYGVCFNEEQLQKMDSPLAIIAVINDIKGSTASAEAV